MANIAVFGSLLYAQMLDSAFEREVTRDDAVVGELTPAPTARLDPRVFLFIGSDSREDLPEDFNTFGNFGGQRADVVMLVRVEPQSGSAQILSIPRDTMVEIEGHGTDKINAAYAYGGAPLMVRTIRETFGVPVHNFVEVDFFGFASIVDAIGGVELCFEYPARDAKSQLDVQAGCYTVDGRTALAYARSRQYEELRGGEWVAQEGGDIARTHRQQELVFAILSALKSPSTVTEAGSLIESLGRYLTIDGALTSGELAELAWAMRGLGADNIEAATLPSDMTEVDGVFYNVLSQPNAEAMAGAFTEGRPMVEGEDAAVTTLPPPPLRLEVLNGNGEIGAAGRWAEALADAGFEVVSVGDADSFGYTTTQILTRPGMAGTEDVVRALGFGQVVTGPVPDGVDAVVIIGTDGAG